MFVDSRTVSSDSVIDTDLCIIGGGAAGITLAREFIGGPMRVCLLESGGFDPDLKTQALAAGESTGLQYYLLVSARLRYLGGSTNHWEGWCRPLDEQDFEARDWVPHSGWPFGKNHLMPYYERAHPVCELGPFVYEPMALAEKNAPPLEFGTADVEPRILRRSPPTRFGPRYRSALEQAGNVHTYLRANVLDIEATPDGRTITRVHVGTLEGNRFWVKAKRFIIAAGGIDNARLLLAANKVQRNGLGNQHDLVGRFFMEHLEMRTGILLLQDNAPSLEFYRIRTMAQEGYSGMLEGALTLSAAAARREKVMNTSFTEMKSMVPPSVESAGELGAALKRFKPRTFWKHLQVVMGDLEHVRIDRDYKSRGKTPPFHRLALSCEQSPNPDSRVMLSATRDKLGMPQARLEWRITDLDRHTIRRASEVVGQAFGHAGFGRAKITLPEDESTWRPYGQWHHIGTTRMHADPKQGVVDANCRVHGMANLYVAGSSVFPTAGVANPTLTIVAMALRLADHLKETLA